MKKIVQRIAATFNNGFKWLVMVVFITATTLVYSALAAPPATPYNPGETLAPTCSPGDPNCTVVPPPVLSDNEVVTGDWDNTANPWAVNELVSQVMTEGENVSLLNNDAGYLTIESDPLFTANGVGAWWAMPGGASISSLLNDAGFITGSAVPSNETDPVYTGSQAAFLTSPTGPGQVLYGNLLAPGMMSWSAPSVPGGILIDNGILGPGSVVWLAPGAPGQYLTFTGIPGTPITWSALTEADPVFSVSPASGIVAAGSGNGNNWDTAYSWGNHATAGYISTETDPVVGAQNGIILSNGLGGISSTIPGPPGSILSGGLVPGSVNWNPPSVPGGLLIDTGVAPGSLAWLAPGLPGQYLTFTGVPGTQMTWTNLPAESDPVFGSSSIQTWWTGAKNVGALNNDVNYLMANGSVDLTNNWTIATKNITLTAGTLRAQTVSDTAGAATMSGGVITGANLTDGVASLTGGSLTGAVGITASGTIQGSVVTDGSGASMTGGAVTGNTLTTGAGASMVGNTVTGGIVTDGAGVAMMSGLLTMMPLPGPVPPIPGAVYIDNAGQPNLLLCYFNPGTMMWHDLTSGMPNPLCGV